MNTVVVQGSSWGISSSGPAALPTRACDYACTVMRVKVTEAGFSRCMATGIIVQAWRLDLGFGIPIGNISSKPGSIAPIESMLPRP